MGTSSGGAFGAEVVRLEPGSKAYIVGAQIKQNKYKTLADSWTVDDSLAECRRLCETAGLIVRGDTYQTMEHPSASTYIGKGKLASLVKTVSSLGVDTVVFDEELSPAQGRNIQEALGGEVQVIDRTVLILIIFEQRARTREAKLQVSAAQLTYMLPRLSTFLTEGAGLDAKGGGAGGGGQFLKGAGETQLEVDRRLFRKQLGRVEAEIEEVQAQRDAYRAKRRKMDAVALVPIVGYTNAGKSTLLNTLCGTEQVNADELVATAPPPRRRRVTIAAPPPRDHRRATAA